MVKRIVTMVLAVLLAGSAAAQRVQLGVRAGVFSQDMELKIPNINNNSILTDSKLGFHIAAVARIRLMAVGSGITEMGLYLQPEVVFSRNNYKILTSNSQTAAAKIKMKAVDIPVLLSFKLSIVRVQAGPVFNVMYKSPSDNVNVDLNSIRPTIGYAAGLSIDIFRGLVLDGRYNGQFKQFKNNLKDGDNIYDSFKSSLSSWTLGLSWLF